MILFRKLRWKNFLSTGEQFIELILDKSPTTLVTGVNGSGKSTFLDALCYALYKKPFRKINKGQIINAVNNADCVVEVEFEIGTHTYKVCRGIKPDFFNIYEDGNLEPRKQSAGRKDDQAYLEEDILKVNFDTFTQIVLLGNAKYTPFMQLNAAQRRSFIEFILDIGVFTTMSDILKDKIKALDIKLDALVREIETNEEKIKLVDGFITKLKADQKRASTDTQRQIDEQNDIITNLTPIIQDLQNQVSVLVADILQVAERLNQEASEKVDEIQAANDAHIAELDAKIVDVMKLTEKLAQWSSKYTSIEREIHSIRTSLDFYHKHDTCDTCKQDIQQEFKEQIVAEKEAEIAAKEVDLAKYEKWVATAKAKLVEDKKSNADIQSQIGKALSAHQVSVQAIMMDSRKESKALTASMQASLDAIQADLQAKKTAADSARQLVKKMQADMKAAVSASNIEDEEKKRDGFISRIGSLEKEKNEGIELKHYYGVASTLLKDSGIKAVIIKQYLATINRLVNKYLAELDFFLSFHLDEKFDETFKSRHRDEMTYHSFSEGEKMRIDLALLFAWREVAHMKNSCSTNLLILDEVIDSSLDHNGTDYFIKMLNQLGQTSNVFVISHKNDAALDKFKDVIRFERQKNFTHLVIDV